MKGGPKSSLRPFLHRALQLLTCQEKFRQRDLSININHKAYLPRFVVFKM